jgi:site-specific DNA-adenine methylase
VVGDKMRVRTGGEPAHVHGTHRKARHAAASDAHRRVWSHGERRERGGAMELYCDHCGFELVYTGAMAPLERTCEVCGVGRMHHGRQDRGFTIDRETFHPMPRDLPMRDYRMVEQGRMGVPEQFNYFSNERGDKYKAFIKANSIYIGRLTNLLVPHPKRFAWLTPYTGNKHNRAHFIQLVLARVAQAKFVDNRGKLPRLIEPFVGSGQVFLNASYWGPSLCGGMPLFSRVIGGDLNHYVIAAYRAMNELGALTAETYIDLAKAWDAGVGWNYSQFVPELDQNGKATVDNADADPGAARTMAFKYMWLVNRCTRGTKLNDNGGITANLNPTAVDRLEAIREREQATLNAVVETLSSLSFELTCQDFQVTCAQAQATDIVFMDCPFPQFTNSIPPVGTAHPEQYGSNTSRTYGTGDDGAAFQTLIVQEALRLVRMGTTVILCNFANPGLIQAYASLIRNDVAAEDRRNYTFTYRSPSTQSEAYLLTVLPGAWNPEITACPEAIMREWISVGGDNNATAEEFFAPKMELTEADRAYERLHEKRAARREEEEDEDYKPGAQEMEADEDDDFIDPDDDQGEAGGDEAGSNRAAMSDEES